MFGSGPCVRPTRVEITYTGIGIDFSTEEKDSESERTIAAQRKGDESVVALELGIYSGVRRRYF